MGVINLTFYSQKLWHSEKPFPKECSYESKISCGSAECRHEGCGFIRSWLSTAYEVVNPIDIKGLEPGLETDIPQMYNLKPLKDGDSITLPEGYGIDKKEVPEFPGFDHTSYPTFKTVASITRPIEYTDAMKATLSDCPWINSDDVRPCIRCEGTGETSPDNQCKRCEGTGIEDHQDLCEKPITLPEKPENSAHGCPKCRTTDFNSCHSMYCPMRKESVVEPSESQEETQDILWMEAFHIYNSEIWNLNGRNKLKEKFTITRK